MELRELRVSKNLTQQQLADRCDIKRNTIAMIETGQSKPSVETAKRIAKVLGFNWTKFFEE